MTDSKARPKPKWPGQWPRRLALGLVCVAALVALAIVGLTLALRSPRVQQSALEGVSESLRERFGVSLAAEGFDLGIIAGRLEVRNLELRAGTADPFARFESVRVRFAPVSLLRGRTRLYSVELHRPWLSLDAELPSAPDSAPEDEPLTSVPVRIDNLEVTEGRIEGSAPAGLRDTLESWRLEDLAIDGHFDGRKLSVVELVSRVRASRPEGGPVELRVEAAAEASLAGDAEIERLRVSGDSLSLDASGHVGREWQSSAGRFRIETDAGVWVRGEPTGVVRLEGEIDLATWSGAARLEAPEQAGVLVAGFLPGELAEALELDNTEVDLDLDLELAADGGTRRVAGEMAAIAKRGGEPILELDARPRFAVPEEGSEAIAGELAAELRLLPRAAGTRTVTARLSTENARVVEAWTIDAGALKAEQPSVERLLATVSGLWPRLLAPASIRSLPKLGALSASGDFGGSIAAPWVKARAELRPDELGRIRVSAEGRPRSGAWSLDAEGSGLEIGHYTASATGRVDFSGRLRDLLGSPEGSLEVAARQIATTSGELLSSLDLSLDGDEERVSWRFEGALTDGGALSGAGGLLPGRPVRSADGDLAWQTGDDRLPRIESSFELNRGVLAASLRAPLPGEVPLTAQLELPLGALESLPQVGDLSALPVERASGPAVLSWQVPSGDWREFLPSELEERVGRLEGASTGRLTFDLACLACSEGLAELTGLVVDLDGRTAAAGGGLRVQLNDGRAAVAPWSVSGDGFELELEGEAALMREWSPGDPVAGLIGAGTGNVSARIDSTWLESLPIEIVSPGEVRVEALASGSPAELVGTASLVAPGLQWTLDAYPTIVLADPQAELGLEGGFVEWKNARVIAGDARVESEGRARIAAPLAEAGGSVTVATGLPVATGAALPFSLTDGRLVIADGEIVTEGGNGVVRVEVPLDGRSGAEVLAQWDLPANDWAPLVKRLAGGEDPDVLRLASRGSLTVPLDQPAALRADVHLFDGRILVRGRETVVEPGLDLLVQDGVATVVPFELRTAAERFRFEARAEIARDWALGDSPADLIALFEVLGKGDIDAGLLNPFLVGGRAEGSLTLDLDVNGTPAAFGGRINVEGPDASILYRSPYLARFEKPSLDISISAGRVLLDRGSFQLNDGALTASGALSDEGTTDLAIQVSDAVFRLDYGLLANLGANLRYLVGSDGASTISGTVDVDRGALTRSVQLDLDLLSQLLAPIDLTTTEDDPLDLIALDLAVRTREGVRVKNNLGDLLVRWEPLGVTGTLARPVIEGSLEVDPGGLLYAYGQTVRLDKAVIEYPGEEGIEPRLDFEATTSLEDPTIGRLAGDDPFRAGAARPARGESAAPMREEVTADLARYYGEQFAGRVGESVGVQLSLRPLLIFGETDPGARLTVSRDLSSYFALAASVDLTNAGARTYLLEAHELRQLPRLVAQGFTDDGSSYGGALLQRQEFGGSKRADAEDLPRISKIETDPPRKVSRRGLKRALAIEKGDPFDARQRFVAEVELVDYLMRKGYPDARVTVRTVAEERRDRRVRLVVEIQPGPFVEVAFEGEKIAKPLRRLIQSLYRPDFFEAESIEEMKLETVRALRSRGFLEPKVEVRVEPLDAERPASDRRVIVSTEGGIKMSSESPIFLGIGADDVERLNAVFANAVQRVELAVGLPSADRRLVAALDGLGYPEARIVSRYQSLGERVLTVELEPGPRRTVALVEVEGVDAERIPEVSRADLERKVTIAAGDPLRRSQLSRSAIAVERELASKGYLDARVRTVLEPAATGDPYLTRVRLLVEPGTLSRLGEVEFRGLRSTRPRFAKKVAELKTGEPLTRDDLSRARSALWRTGLFRGVGAETVESQPGVQLVTFDLEERARYRLTYGLRWDSEDGAGAVFDATDDNFLGRGWTLGMRALTSNDEDSLRFLARVPRAFSGPGALELFAAARQFSETSTDVIFGTVEVPVSVLESTLQYSHPASQRTTYRIYGRYTDTERKLPFFDLRVRNPQLGLQYVFDSRSPEALTETGAFASVDLSGSQEFLGGDLRYARMFSQLNLYRPAGRLFGSRLSWSQSFRLGLAEAFGQVLIRDVRFFAGGEFSVRGYGSDSLGELELFGAQVEATGGSALLVISQELRWRLFNDYSLVFFADAGNVWQEVGDLGSDLFTSSGLGLRAVTPVGLLRLDIAHALKQRIGVDPEFKIYFGLGTTF